MVRFEKRLFRTKGAKVGRVTPCAPPGNGESPSTFAARRGLRALPERGRRAIIGAKNPYPIFGPLAQTFANRIHQNIMRLLFQFVMIAEPMIVKVSLPMHAMLSCHELLPVPDRGFHPRLARERKNGMQMVRHQQTQTAVPEERIMIVFHRREDRVTNTRPAQLIFSHWDTLDGDEEPTAGRHALWDFVRELFADWQIHAPSVMNGYFPEQMLKVGRVTPCAPLGKW
jgi:hypothetical protein